MKRNSLTIAIAVITLVAAALFVWTFVHATVYAPDQELPSPPVVAATSSLPDRLGIPSLGIDAAVQQVGVKPSGNMANPSNFTDVGWYKLGTVPGQLGSAVIAGHVDNGLSLAGVFKHLSDIKKGDDVYVIDKAGTRLHFVVTDVQLYSYDAAPTDVIFNRKDKARLNIITCDGAWIKDKKTYDQRLVVFTELQKS